MDSREHNLTIPGQIVKHIPPKLIDSLKRKHRIRTRAFSATSHVVAILFAQLCHALSLNDICDRLEAEFPQAFHFDKGDDLEPQKPGAAD